MKQVAIVGGGPGGLFTARLLAESCGDLCRTTIFEGQDRLGGKIITRQFQSEPARYEAGLAEFYDYSHFSEDPVRNLVEELGLSTVPLRGPTVILGDKVLTTDGDIRRKLGAAAADALDDFHERCEAQYTADDYYETYWRADNIHPLAGKTFAQELDEIPNELARRYAAVAAHTDVAVPPHGTNALNGVKNVLMDNDKYMKLYAIEGGNAKLIDRLAETTTATIELNALVTKIAKTSNGRYRLTVRRGADITTADFDYVVLALPNYWLQAIEFDGATLRRAMDRHLAHYDHPAHYLRVSALFREPFWRSIVKGSYWMQDSFGGACLYDEGSRTGDGHSVLGWLIAGSDALAMANLADEVIIRRVIDSLPPRMAHGREMLIEAHVQRWVGTVNALPGGLPVEEVRVRHQPEPTEHAALLTVGDYLFDSTVNAVYDSARFRHRHHHDRPPADALRDPRRRARSLGGKRRRAGRRLPRRVRVR